MPAGAWKIPAPRLLARTKARTHLNARTKARTHLNARTKARAYGVADRSQ